MGQSIWSPTPRYPVDAGPVSTATEYLPLSCCCFVQLTRQTPRSAVAHVCCKSVCGCLRSSTALPRCSSCMLTIDTPRMCASPLSDQTLELQLRMCVCLPHRYTRYCSTAKTAFVTNKDLKPGVYHVLVSGAESLSGANLPAAMSECHMQQYSWRQHCTALVIQTPSALQAAAAPHDTRCTGLPCR